jgi:hypothetical protein
LVGVIHEGANAAGIAGAHDAGPASFASEEPASGTRLLIGPSSASGLGGSPLKVLSEFEEQATAKHPRSVASVSADPARAFSMKRGFARSTPSLS